MSTDLRAAYLRAGLRPRVITALVGIPLILGAAWGGGLWWTILVVAIMMVGVTEFVRLHPGLSMEARAAAAGGALVLTSLIVTLSGRAAAVLILAASLWLAVAVLAHLRAPVETGTVVWGRWPTAVLGAVYLGLAGGVLIRWRLEASAAAIVWLLATIWLTDIAAYFVGLAAGRHKVAPRISPGKSVEGGAAGIVAATVVAAVGSGALGVPAWAGAALGIAISVASQAGDLFKSTMKRRVGVKDSGTLLPGHGGIIDRFDGLLVAAPVAYLFVRLTVRLLAR